MHIAYTRYASKSFSFFVEVSDEILGIFAFFFPVALYFFAGFAFILALSFDVQWMCFLSNLSIAHTNTKLTSLCPSPPPSLLRIWRRQNCFVTKSGEFQCIIYVLLMCTLNFKASHKIEFSASVVCYEAFCLNAIVEYIRWIDLRLKSCFWFSSCGLRSLYLLTVTISIDKLCLMCGCGCGCGWVMH